jgi:NADP-reducing hydrogenase subunit HndB
MDKIKSLEDLRTVREEALKKRKTEIFSGKKQVIISMGTAGIAAGVRDTVKAIKDFIQEQGLSNVIIRQIGNFGLDSREPVIQVITGNEPPVTYGNVTPDIAHEIMRKHIVDGVIHESHVIRL